MTAAFDALFVVLNVTIFQLAVVLLIAGGLCFLIGTIWGGRARDNLDDTFFGCDISAGCRAGLIERRQIDRSTGKRTTARGGLAR